MGIFQRDLNKQLAKHIGDLDRFGFLPDNWLWKKDKVKELKEINKDLIDDLVKLHKEHKDTPGMFENVLPLLQKLAQDLEIMIRKRPSVEIQRKEANTVNALTTQIKKLLKKDKKDYLQEWGLNVQQYPALTKFLEDNFEDASELVEESDYYLKDVFSIALPAIKDLINNKTWPKIKNLIITVAKRSPSIFKRYELFRLLVRRKLEEKKGKIVRR